MSPSARDDEERDVLEKLREIEMLTIALLAACRDLRLRFTSLGDRLDTFDDVDRR